MRLALLIHLWLVDVSLSSEEEEQGYPVRWMFMQAHRWLQVKADPVQHAVWKWTQPGWSSFVVLGVFFEEALDNDIKGKYDIIGRYDGIEQKVRRHRALARRHRM